MKPEFRVPAQASVYDLQVCPVCSWSLYRGQKSPSKEQESDQGVKAQGNAQRQSKLVIFRQKHSSVNKQSVTAWKQVIIGCQHLNLLQPLNQSWDSIDEQTQSIMKFLSIMCSSQPSSRSMFLQLQIKKINFLEVTDIQWCLQHNWMYWSCRLSDCSSEVWIKHCQTYPKIYRNMFRAQPRATLGLIFFTVLIQKSAKIVESPLWLSEKFALGNSLGQIFPGFHCGHSIVYTSVHGTVYIDTRCFWWKGGDVNAPMLGVWYQNV